MLRFRSLFSLILLALALAAPARAQDGGGGGASVEPERPDVALSIGGTLQPRLSYGRLAFEEASGSEENRERIGFGLRRARLRVRATLAERAGAYLQFGGAGLSAELLDAILFFDLTGALRLRMGRFPGAQPRAFQPTSHQRIDVVERAAIARRWGSSTLGNSGRDFGLEALYETDRLTAQLGLYNGDGSWDRAEGNVRPDIVGDPTGSADTRGLAAGGYSAWRPAALPGVEVGGYAGYNGARNTATRPSEEAFPGLSLGPFADRVRSYASYAGHLYWGARPGSQRVRLKADLIGTRYETLSPPAALPEGPAELEQHALGASLLGAVAFFDRSAELLARFERYDPATGRANNATDYLTVGASLSLSALRGRPYARQRLTLAYAMQDPVGAAPRAHLVVLQAQIVF